MSVLLLGSLLPSVSFAQDGGLERHLSRGEGLYRMEKYGEAFMEFGKAGRYAAGADAAVRERLCRLLAMSAAQAGEGEAQELLETYLTRYPAGPGAVEVRFELGNLFFGEGDYAAATEWMPANCRRRMRTNTVSNTGMPVSSRSVSRPPCG